MRALFLRRVLLHRSTRADLVYCVASLATFGAILGWAVVSTSWIGEGVASFLAGRFGERAPEAPTVALVAARTVALFLAYDLGFFVDHTLKHRIPALWELHKTHHSADPAHFNRNMGASLALWDWLIGSLRLPSARSPRLKYGISGFDHDPHGAIGLVVEPAAKALAALARMIAPRAAGERRST